MADKVFTAVVEVDAESVKKAMDEAVRAADRFEVAMEGVTEATEGDTKARKAQIQQIKRMEAAYKRGLTPAGKTALALEKIKRETVAGSKAMDLQAKAVDSLSTKLKDQLRREAANAGRSLSMLFDETREGREQTNLFLAVQTEAIKAMQKGTANAVQQTIVMAQQAETASDVVDAIAKLRFETNDAQKASDEYKATMAALNKRLGGMRIEAKEAAKASEELAEGFERSKKRADSLETAMDALGVPGASFVMQYKEVNDSLETMAELGDVNGVRMLKLGMGIAAAGAAAAAAVAGLAAVGAALVANSAKADEWNQELKDIGLSLDAVGTAAVDRAAAGIDLVGRTGQAVGVAIANTFAPAIETASVKIVALGLDAVDTWNNLTAGMSAVEIVSRVVGEGLAAAFNAVISPIKNVGAAYLMVMDLLPGGKDDMSLRWLKGFEDLGDAVADDFTAKIQGLIGDGLEPLSASMSKNEARAVALLSRQVTLNRATRDTTEAIKEQGDELEANTESTAVYLKGLAGLDSFLADVTQNSEQAIMSQDEAARAAVDGLGVMAKAIADSGRKGAGAAFAAQKALYAASIVMDSIKAGTSTFAQAPGGVVAKGVQAGIASAAVLTQLAALRSMSAPKFHGGTSRVSNTNAGDVQATLRGDESVLTGAASDRLGRGTIDALNAGGGTSMAPTVVNAYNGRVFDWALRDSRSRGGAAAGFARRQRISGLA